MVLLTAFLLLLLPHDILATPHPAAFLHRRNESITPPTTPGIDVAITNNNSLDITSTFQTRVWVQPEIVAQPNLTGRGTTGGARLINKCRSPTAHFRYSHCNHIEDIEGSMQRYVVFCRERPPPQNWYETGGRGLTHLPPVMGEQGSCEPDEICLNGLWRRTRYSAVARCVKKDDFRFLTGGSGDSDVQLGNRMASVVLSREDGSRPIGADSIGAAYAESDYTQGSQKMGTDSNSCSDCFELRTQKFGPDVNSLKVEASVMSAGAVMGVVWLGLLSG